MFEDMSDEQLNVQIAEFLMLKSNPSGQGRNWTRDTDAALKLVADYPWHNVHEAPEDRYRVEVHGAYGRHGVAFAPTLARAICEAWLYAQGDKS